MNSLIDLKLRFKKIIKSLEVKPWFKKNGWICSVHEFPADEPEGVTFHVFKKHWFNQDHQGIHFESFLYLDAKKSKKSYVTLHILHQDKIPGTKLNRIIISKPFVDEIKDEVDTWEGFSFRAGKYGKQPFTKLLDGSRPDYERELVKDITRMCKALGPVIDKVIKMSEV
jgi:hypothetical protein